MSAKNNTIYKYFRIILFIRIIISIKVLFLHHEVVGTEETFEDLVIFKYFFSYINVTDYIILLTSIISRCSYLKIMFLFI